VIGNILSPTHLLIVLAVALLVLGPKRIPAAGRGLGEAMRNFKDALAEGERTEENRVERPEEVTRGIH